jgi:hypothetical protein
MQSIDEEKQNVNLKNKYQILDERRANNNKPERNNQ